MRLKQICNHPAQLLGNGDYDPEHSGKFQRLAELCEELAQRQEKALVFTQFREMAEPLARFLEGVFGRPGLVLHGGTAVGKRRDLVESFQQRKRTAVLCPFAQGRGHRAEPDRGVAGDSFRSLVEPGRRRTRPPTALFASARNAMCWSTNSSAGAPSRSGSTP